MQIEAGDKALFSKTISEYDVYAFAGLVGDFNPIHINEMAAGKSLFEHRVAHGILVAGLISAVIGTKLPGEGSIYLEQKLSFRAPVYIGDTVTAEVAVKEVLNVKKGIYKLDTNVRNQNGDPVIEGFAIVKYKMENGFS